MLERLTSIAIAENLNTIVGSTDPTLSNLVLGKYERLAGQMRWLDAFIAHELSWNPSSQMLGRMMR